MVLGMSATRLETDAEMFDVANSFSTLTLYRSGGGDPRDLEGLRRGGIVILDINARGIWPASLGSLVPKPSTPGVVYRSRGGRLGRCWLGLGSTSWRCSRSGSGTSGATAWRFAARHGSGCPGAPRPRHRSPSGCVESSCCCCDLLTVWYRSSPQAQMKGSFFRTNAVLAAIEIGGSATASVHPRVSGQQRRPDRVRRRAGMVLAVRGGAHRARGALGMSPSIFRMASGVFAGRGWKVRSDLCTPTPRERSVAFLY